MRKPGHTHPLRTAEGAWNYVNRSIPLVGSGPKRMHQKTLVEPKRDGRGALRLFALAEPVAPWHLRCCNRIAGGYRSQSSCSSRAVSRASRSIGCSAMNPTSPLGKAVRPAGLWRRSASRSRIGASRHPGRQTSDRGGHSQFVNVQSRSLDVRPSRLSGWPARESTCLAACWSSGAGLPLRRDPGLDGEQSGGRLAAAHPVPEARCLDNRRPGRSGQ